MASPTSYETRHRRFADATAAQWSDWRWQHRNRLRTLDEIDDAIGLSPAERAAFVESAGRFRVAITPHYLSLIDPDDARCPVRLQAVPQPGELDTYAFELADPLAEEAHMPVPGLTHRYPDRVLLYASHHCPVYCRHCTRKRKVSNPETAASRDQLAGALDYIRRTPQVRDVLVSGGDPLTLSDARLGDLLRQVRAIEHVEVLRLGTRNPVTLPQRITPTLCDLLAEVGPVYLHTHFNHPRELGADARRALRMLGRAGCVLGNQMVLLRGINDDAEIVLELNRALLAAGCRPYYILQCDMSEGITHFRTPLQVGIDIVDHLRGRIGGMGVPDFVVDLPGGGGKVELTPDYIVDSQPTEGGRQVTFRNWDGRRFEFFDVSIDDK